MTWKGARTDSASRPDPLEDALSELVREAQQDMDGTWAGGRGDGTERGELIESADDVTLVLMVPGHSRRDFSVVAEGTSLMVETYDLKLVRKLGCPVDPGTVRTTYVNGVLSVRVDKKL